MNRKVTFVIGATASGKTTFIKNHFSSNADTLILNVYDYQQKAYNEAGFKRLIPYQEQFKCLYKANEKLLADIIDNLKNRKNVIVEQTFYRAKRRIRYIDAIKEEVKDVQVEVYVMCPSDLILEKYVSKRQLAHSFSQLKSNAQQIEFPNPSEGFDNIYEVADNVIKLRMSEPNPEIVENARAELLKESEKIKL